jgi:hypothetical protein
VDPGDFINFIRNEPEHHKKKNFEEEYRSLIIQSAIKTDGWYFL